MTRRETLITLDLGTTSCRALLFQLDGHVLAQASRSYPLHTPAPGHVEQDPETLLGAAAAVVAEVAAQATATGCDVIGVSLCTYMHSLVALDAAGNYLSPLTTWADGRAVREVTEVRARPDWFDLYARTGCPPHPMYPLYRLLWLQKHEPELLARADRFVSIKELLVERWAGQSLVDFNVASASGLFNLRTLDWDEWALELTGVGREQLNEAVPTLQTVPLTAGGLGLKRGTPIVIGAADGVLSSLGSGAIAPGVLAAMVGTSGAVRACAPDPVVDPQARVFSYYLDQDRWIIGGALNNGGIVLRWLREQFFPDATSYEEILAAAATIPPGAGGLVFLPYLTGERSPGYRAEARGVWFGLGLEHTRAHLARSVLEAIAFRLRSVLGPIEQLTGPAREIRATGGFARSRLWLQICADVFGRDIACMEQAEGSSLGAFALGTKALGLTDDLTAVQSLVAVDETLRPDRQRQQRYEELFAIYQSINQGLQDNFRALARFREGSV